MLLTNYVKSIIEDNLDNIQKGNFTDIYEQFDTADLNEGQACGEFTLAMYSAGIDPLDYLNGVIPFYFMQGQKAPKNFKIPEGVTTISPMAFERTIFKDIDLIIPKSCLNIQNEAFDTAEIDVLKLENNNCDIEQSAFQGAFIHNLYLDYLPENIDFLLSILHIKKLYISASEEDIEDWILTIEGLDSNGETISLIDQHNIGQIISTITGKVVNI